MQIDARNCLGLFEGAAFVIDRQGALVASNKEFDAQFPETPADFFAALDDQDETLARVMKAASRMSGRLPVSLRMKGGPLLNGWISRLEQADRSVAGFLIVLKSSDPQQFKALTEKISELNNEIHRHKNTAHELREALTENSNLLREIRHRVKNNIQVQMSLLERQAAFLGEDKFEELTDKANSRLWALSQPLHSMYKNENLEWTSASELFTSVIEFLQSKAPPATEIKFSQNGSWAIPNDNTNAFVLILNELISNAIEHGLNGAPGKITVTLDRSGDTMILEVRDPGKGLPGSLNDANTFGLFLVRGLSQQMNARFDHGYDHSAFCRLTINGAFPEDVPHAA